MKAVSKSSLRKATKVHCFRFAFRTTVVLTVGCFFWVCASLPQVFAQTPVSNGSTTSWPLQCVDTNFAQTLISNGSITVSGDWITSPNPCTIDHSSASLSSLGGLGTINVRAPSGWQWGVKFPEPPTDPCMVFIPDAHWGYGNGYAVYQIFCNPGTQSRVITFWVAGRSFTVFQSASPTPDQPAPATTDLAIVDMTVTSDNEVIGADSTLVVTIKNRGEKAAKNFTLSVWFDRNAPARCGQSGDANTVISTLNAGATKTLSFPFTRGQKTGTRNALAFVDSTCATAEGSEAKKQKSAQYEVVSPPQQFEPVPPPLENDGTPTDP